MIPRLIEKPLKKMLETKHKIVLLFGARQVGKTTILNRLVQNYKQMGRTTLYLNCDLDEDFNMLNTTSLTRLTTLLKNTEFLFVDEAQRLNDAGLTLKIIHDQFPKVRVLTTGSSSLDLKNKLSDPLTGRYFDFYLYPFSLREMMQGQDYRPEYILETTIQYGLYPEITLDNNPANKIRSLGKIIESYLFKDILAFQKIRHPDVLKNLTSALAYQIGSEINENELAGRLKVDRKTIANYLDLLEKTFVIIRVYPFSKNPRREIGRRYKIYFIDLGLRNALIGDYNIPSVRADLGHIWENFLILERLKKYANCGTSIRYNFWRNYGGAEVDYIEQELTKPEIKTYEFKYTDSKLSRGALSFEKEYKCKANVINKNNFMEFI